MLSKVKPILSVILPVFNAEKYVTQAIDSILDQSFKDFELLVADDGSKDGSKKLLNLLAVKDNRIKVSHNNENQGKIRTVNRLFKECKGEYITIHDADDWSQEDRFEKQVDFLQNNKHIGLCSTSFNVIDKLGQKINTKIDLSKEEFHGPTIMFPSRIVQEVGGLYRPLFIVAEDTDFIDRVREKYPIKMINQPLYYYRWTSNSLTKSIRGYTPERYAIYDLLNHLKNERKQNGSDSLMDGNKSLVDREYIKMVSKWNSKKDEIYIDGINRSASFQLYNNAFSLAFKLLWLKPFSLKPYKYIAYLIYQSISNLTK